MNERKPKVRHRRARFVRFKWSHEGTVHRWLVRLVNHILFLIPTRAKYGAGMLFRRNQPPYALVHDGDVVIQVGAPHDTLRSGRSRAFYFGLLVGERGRVIAVEPDAASAQALRAAAAAHGNANITVVERAAWSGETTLRVFIDDRHPATNFTAGAKAYDERRMRAYRHVDLRASSLDQIARELGIAVPIALVSITTNGAEGEILAGMGELIARGVAYIAIADTGVVSETELAALGYELLSFDDRGRTFASSRLRASTC